MSLEGYVSIDCSKGGGKSCKTCVDMCKQRPCWPTPDEAKALVEKGYGNRLMTDYWVGGGPDGDDIHLLSPAMVGYEGRSAPFTPIGRCTFLSPDGLCELHELGLKPVEGRVANCADESVGNGIHQVVAFEWNNPDSQKIVEDWQKK